MKKIALALGLSLASATAASAQFSAPEIPFPSFPKEFVNPQPAAETAISGVDFTATGSTGTVKNSEERQRLGDGSPVYKN